MFLVERLDRLFELLGLGDVLDDRVHVVAVPLQAVLHLLSLLKGGRVQRCQLMKLQGSGAAHRPLPALLLDGIRGYNSGVRG